MLRAIRSNADTSTTEKLPLPRIRHQRVQPRTPRFEPGYAPVLIFPDDRESTLLSQERWAIKTLTDSDAETVGNAVPQNTTVTALIGETAPAKLTDTRVPLEKQRFRLTALIIGWKIEAATAAENFGKKASESTSVPDHDFHIVIADPNNTNNQMIMEVPDPRCEAVCSSKFLAQISQVRNEVSSRLGTPSDTVQPLPQPWLVEITGPAFFDFPHGQDGLATNCIEIHPVMEITFVKQQGSEITPHKATDLKHTCGKR